MAQSTPSANRTDPNFAQPDAGFPPAAGCWLIWRNCAPQFVQNPVVAGRLRPQYGHNMVEGAPQPVQNLCPARFWAPHLGHVYICCISAHIYLRSNLFALLRLDVSKGKDTASSTRNSYCQSKNFPFPLRFSMSEVAHAGKDHSHIVPVGCGDDFFVSHRASRLNYGGYTTLSSHFDGIRERYHSVGSEHAALC